MKQLRALLLLVLVALTACASSAPSIVTNAQAPIYRIIQLTDDKIFSGTAFLVPGTGQLLMTAAHNLDGGGTMLLEVDGLPVPIHIMKKGDANKVDAALVMVENPLKDINPFLWAEDEPSLWEVVWFLGYPGALSKVLAGYGVVVSEDESLWQERIGGDYLAMTAPGLLLGHSGSPVFDQKGRIVGMMVKEAESGGKVQLAVPAKVLRKFMK
jgi:hypothetical protein